MGEARVRIGMRSLMATSASVVAVLLLGTVAPGATIAAPILEAARRPDAVVVVYRELLGEMAGTDRGPTLTLYGDGRLVAHYPLYMKRAGDWERRLAPRERDALLASLAAKGVLDFDAAATRAAVRTATQSARDRARAARQPVVLFEASDQSTTVIEVTANRYVPATPGAREVRDVQRRVAWTGLRVDAAAHPDVPALRNLAAAEQELRALRDHPGFTRVRR